MHSSKRILLSAAGLLVAIALAGTAAAANATAPRPHQPRPASGASHLSLERFDLNGYVFNTSYTLGRNTGNTFRQTYGFAHHTVFDYAPGSARPESAGTVTIVHRGQRPLP